MVEPLLIALLVLVAITLVLLVVVLVRLARLAAAGDLSKDVVAQLLRGETELIRRAGDDQARGLRVEVSDHLKGVQDSIVRAFGVLGDTVTGQVRGFGGQLDGGLRAIDQRVHGLGEKLDADMAALGEGAERGRESLRGLVDTRLDAAAVRQAEDAKGLREELGQGFHRLGGNVATTLGEMGERQRERLDKTAVALDGLGEKHERSGVALRTAVEERLDVLRRENAAKLDEMRQTVDEKLHATLETRLGESFNRVVEQLARVYEGLGEMKSLAANVGDLKNVLSNVKVRGTFGEVQLEMLLEQFLTGDQYVKNAQVRSGSAERVEFAVRFPGKGGGSEVLLPVDAKFPRETYERLIEASQAGDAEQVRQHRRQLESQIRAFAKDISAKYVHPPRTTDFAILFLPTEGLYAEMLRQVGLFEGLQRDHKVTLAGPTTLAAILNAFQMGFRSIAIEKRSGEVWQVLGAVQAEFRKYNEVVDKLGSQLSTAARSVESLGTRTRKMNDKLKSVQALPDGTAAADLLGFSDEAAAPESVVVSIKERERSVVIAADR